MSNRIIVGISGASCSGKTTLAKLLRATFPWASVIHQDAYYHPNDPKYHVYLPDVKHFNWDLKSAVNFPRLESDLHRVLRLQIASETSRNFGLASFDEKLLHCPNDDFVWSISIEQKLRIVNGIQIVLNHTDNGRNQ